MNRTLIAIASAALIALAACTQAPPPDTREADAKALRTLETSWAAALAAKDIDKFVTNYTDDAMVFAPSSPAMKGKANIIKDMKGMASDPNFSLVFETTGVEVAKSGDFAVTYGTYQLKMTNPMTKQPMDDKGNYVTNWKKTADGSWKAYLDINTSEMPPPMPETKTPGKK